MPTPPRHAHPAVSDKLLRVLATTVACLLLAGGVASVALAGSGSSTPIMKAQASAFAMAVNLKASDLPQAEVLPISKNDSSQGAASRELQCGHRGRPLGLPLLDEASAMTDPYDGVVISAVVVMRSEALAQKLATALNSRRARKCLTRELGVERISGGKQSISSHTVKARVVSLAKTFGAGALGLHVLAEWPPSKARGASREFTHASAAFFRAGPAEIVFLEIGTRPFPPAVESHLLSLLYTRAEANKL